MADVSADPTLNSSSHAPVPARPALAPTLALALSLSLALAACSQKEAAPEPVRAVKLMTVGEAPVQARPEYSGEVRARIESRLGFRVAGKLTERNVQLGQHVSAGQLLAQLDARDYQLSADAARAQLVSATTQRDLAAADAGRYQQLRDKNFISAAEMDRRQANLKAAQAQLDQAKAQLAAQTNQSSYTRLLADVPGVITSVDAEPGQVVTAGAPVVRIAQDGARDVVFNVPEDLQALVKPGQAVDVRPWVDEFAPRQGRVREVAASADPATRTYQVKVALADEAGQAAPPLGATVHVALPGPAQQKQSVIKLPGTALRAAGKDGQGSAVWLFDPATSTVKLQSVVVASADGNEAVIASGLQPGMQVVTTGVHVLNPGQKVSVYKNRYDQEKKVELEQDRQAQAAINKEEVAREKQGGGQ